MPLGGCDTWQTVEPYGTLKFFFSSPALRPRGDLTEDNMETENAAAAAAAAFTASSQLKEAVLGMEPAGQVCHA